MINYYYWFACFSYCDARTIENNKCCPNIRKSWDLVYSKEYNSKFDFLGFVLDLISFIDSDIIAKDVPGIDITFIKDKIKDIIEKSLDTLSYASSIIGTGADLLYQYNFVILKNDEYKKIVVSFPGITTILQILDEIVHSGMFEIFSLKIKGKLFKSVEMFYNTFDAIQEDLFDNLKKLNNINNGEYQVILTGHSIGGAVATLSSIYYMEKYQFQAENILITFGQPRVLSESMAKYLTNNLKQIYRVAKPFDIGTLFPFIQMEKYFQLIKTFK